VLSRSPQRVNERQLVQRGHTPAINVGISVSRVGGNAQIKPCAKWRDRCVWIWRSIATRASSRSSARTSWTGHPSTVGARPAADGSLKQDQYQPLSVEKQVLSIYVATSGLMDAIPVNEVRRFESELLQFVETSLTADFEEYPREEGADDAIRADIKKAVEAFRERFTAAVAAAAN